MTSGKSSREGLRHLIDHGYQCFEVGAEGRLRPHRLLSDYKYANIVAGHPRSTRFGSLIQACDDLDGR